MNRLYETIRNIKGIDYRYWGFGKLSLIIGPKSDPAKVKEENILKLLGYLDNQEESDLKLYDEDRQKLVNSLSGDYQTNYLKLRKENLQTRLRRLEEGIPQKKVIISKITMPMINRINKYVIQHAGFNLKEKKNFEEFLKNIEEDLKNDKT